MPRISSLAIWKAGNLKIWFRRASAQGPLINLKDLLRLGVPREVRAGLLIARLGALVDFGGRVTKSFEKPVETLNQLVA